MARKRITEIMPFLLPLRIWQRNLFYQIGLKFDKNKYAKKISGILDFEIVKERTLMKNENSGYDIKYQEGKIENLKIISKTMNHVLIYPHETFSFCYLSKNARKYGKFKEGLVLENNEIVPKKGGGICHLSNLLYSLFLKTPLTIVERHGHRVKSLPNPDPSSLEGIDATINSGWLDLKVRNDTDNIYQIVIDFDDEYMEGIIMSDHPSNEKMTIKNENFHYFKKNNKIYESVDVVKVIKDKQDKVLAKTKLYEEVVEVTYELPKDAEIEEIK